MLNDPRSAGPRPPFPKQQQSAPGRTGKLDPVPDHGERSYQGHDRLAGCSAIVTGGDSGIGRAVAIAYAREGADVLISYLDEHDDAEETKQWVEKAGQKAVLMAGNLTDPQHCRSIVDTAMQEFGHLDVLVSNAAFQQSHQSITEIPDDEWDYTLATNLSAFFHLAKAAVPKMQPGASIIGTSSVNSDSPPPELLAYSVTKAGIANMCAS